MKDMILKESGDKRFHMTDYGIPTIQLGCGGTTIGALYSQDDEDFTGVSFTLNNGGYIGEERYEIAGMNTEEAGSFLQITATKPESLDVLIQHLTIAREWLKKKQEGISFEDQINKTGNNNE